MTESSYKSLATSSHLCAYPSLNQKLSPLSSPPILPLLSSHLDTSTFDSVVNTNERSLFVPSGQFVDQSKETLPTASDSLIRFLKPRIAIAEEHMLISPSNSLSLHPPVITHSSASSCQPQSPSFHYVTKPATIPATSSLLTSSMASPVESPAVLSSKGEIGYCTDAVSDYDVADTAGVIPTVYQYQEVLFPLSRTKDVRSRDCCRQMSLSREAITITVDDEDHPDRTLGKINTTQTFSLGNAFEDYRSTTSATLVPTYPKGKTIPFMVSFTLSLSLSLCVILLFSYKLDPYVLYCVYI